MNPEATIPDASLHLGITKKSKLRGIKPQYRYGYAAQAHKLCLLGVQDRDLAAFFGICRKTM